MEKCANCHREIGEWEQAFVVKQQTVCKKCHELLNRPPRPPILSTLPFREGTVGMIISGALLRGFGIIIFPLGMLSALISQLPLRYDTQGFPYPRTPFDTCILIAIFGVVLFGYGSWLIKAGRETR